MSWDDYYNIQNPAFDDEDDDYYDDVEDASTDYKLEIQKENKN